MTEASTPSFHPNFPAFALFGPPHSPNPPEKNRLLRGMARYNRTKAHIKAGQHNPVGGKGPKSRQKSRGQPTPYVRSLPETPGDNNPNIYAEDLV